MKEKTEEIVKEENLAMVKKEETGMVEVKKAKRRPYNRTNKGTSIYIGVPLLFFNQPFAILN